MKIRNCYHCGTWTKSMLVTRFDYKATGEGEFFCWNCLKDLAEQAEEELFIKEPPL